jgi:hypothetical protein
MAPCRARVYRMIDLALSFLANRINGYVTAETGNPVGVAKVGPIAGIDGKWVVPAKTVAVSLISVDEERTLKAQVPDREYVDGRQLLREPKLRVDLHVLFAAHWPDEYDKALQAIAHVLTYFQSHPSFTADTCPDLDPRIERLAPVLQSLTYEQLNQVWGFVGAKLLPSVVYRVRTIALQGVQPSSIQPPITTVTTAVVRR